MKVSKNLKVSPTPLINSRFVEGGPIVQYFGNFSRKIGYIFKYLGNFLKPPASRRLGTPDLLRVDSLISQLLVDLDSPHLRNKFRRSLVSSILAGHQLLPADRLVYRHWDFAWGRLPHFEEKLRRGEDSCKKTKKSQNPLIQKNFWLSENLWRNCE